MVAMALGYSAKYVIMIREYLIALHSSILALESWDQYILLADWPVVSR